jgi:hypothetical protein
VGDPFLSFLLLQLIFSVSLLFGVADVTEQEITQLFPDADTIADCITSINSWKQRREELRNFLEQFNSEAAFKVRLTRSFFKNSLLTQSCEVPARQWHKAQWKRYWKGR